MFDRDELKKKYHTEFEDSFSEEVWKTTYKDHKDNTVDDTLLRVAADIASVEETEELRDMWTENFYEMLSGFGVVPGGRILSNAGTEWGGTTYINCFVSPRDNEGIDSLNGIMRNLTNQSNTLKAEGGWGENFSHLRPRGSFIEGIGVETPGAVKYMELFDKSSEIITSGSGKKSNNIKAKGKIRKGAMMGVLDVWSPDIYEFITAKQQPGRLTKFNISVNCTDEFMNKLINVMAMKEQGAPQEAIDVENAWDLIFPDTTVSYYDAEWDGNISKWKAKGYPVKVYEQTTVTALWDKIMESTYARAEPGVLFLDRANHFNPLSYAEHIASTNPSMPAGTKVYTRHGIVPIESLEGKTFQVKSLDGRWAQAECRLSGRNQDLIEIDFGGMRKIKSTKEHRWPVLDRKMNRLYKVDASDLKIGDRIPLNLNEIMEIEGNTDLTYDEGLLVGYMLGDGWITEYKGQWKAGITFGTHERTMAERILSIVNNLKDNESALCERENHGKGELYIQFTDTMLMERFKNTYGWVLNKERIPSSVWTSNPQYIRGFVDGLFSADGSISKYSNMCSRITLTTAKEGIAFDIAKLLGFAGIYSSIITTDTAASDVSFPGKTYSPEDERVFHRWDVVVQGRCVINFANVFSMTHPDKKERLYELVKGVEHIRDHFSTKYVQVQSINECGSEDVWDISVYHDQHVFPTEWCYTGNCGEQVLAPGNVCCLSSLNLTQFFDEATNSFDFNKFIKYAKFAVRFLDNVNTRSQAPLPEYKESMMTKRRIGVGLMGWGSLLYMMKIPFASEQALEFKQRLLETFSKATYEASIDLAVEKGMFQLCEPEKHANQPFVKKLKLSADYMTKLRTTGIRNSALMSNQPTGNSSIFANIVSGGIEPVFMPEYIRTVIVNSMPEEIADVCPKWYEGEWKETTLFHFTKEGDEEILRGEFNGTIYKIDKNRGLTKEVLCQDYGVRWLSARNEWDAAATWAKTTANLTAIDHVEDLKGFAEYADSAVSKTINVPHDYPYEDFKNLYLEAYRTGYIKGLTTYRAGTMTTVLAAKDEKTASADQEEIVQDNVTIPAQSPAIMNTIKAEGKKYYLTTIMDSEMKRPIALFVTTNHHEKTVTTHDAVERLLTLAREKKIPEQWILDTEQKIVNDTNVNKLARTISLLLRHGVFIKNIVFALDRVEDVYVGTFLFQIKKYLSQYIKDGEKVEDKTCDNCGSSNIEYSSGCFSCKDCGSSKCG